MKEYKFWLVMSDNFNVQSDDHHSEKAAHAEAESLSKQHIGVRFFVMEAKAAYVAEAVTISHKKVLEAAGEVAP
jgi:hypothetical protein